MWLYNTFPVDRVQKQYGFTPTQEWLDHLRLSSVRFNNGGSGSFVSADGLAFTNHHVGSDCIAQLATSGADYMKSGFYARARADEAKCPDLELNVLVGIDDVTAKVKAAATPSMSDADASHAQRSAMSAIEKDCATSTGLRCDVVTLYSGEVYNLYRSVSYTHLDVYKRQALFFAACAASSGKTGPLSAANAAPTATSVVNSNTNFRPMIVLRISSCDHGPVKR